MSTAQLSLWVAALAVGLFSAWRNPTACALVLAFAFSEAGLPIEYYAYPDLLTLALIFTKPRYRPCPEYWDLDTWHLLKCIVIERTPSDRFIMLSLPLSWSIYVAGAGYYQWWTLFWLAIAQFIAAGLEPLVEINRRRIADAVSRQPDPGPLLIAYPAGGWSG